MKKLNILQLIDTLDIGGAEVLSVNIANELAKRENITSFFCVTRKEGDLKVNIYRSVDYFFLNRKKTIDLKAILKLKKYIKKNRIDIIHAHLTSSFLAVCVKIIYPRIKIIWHNHTGNYEQIKGNKLIAIKLHLLFINHIINVSSKLNKWVKNKLNFNRSIYLPNFSVFTNKEQTTKLFGVTGKRIVHLAGFRQEKDHLNLLRAFKIILKSNKEFTLHLIGKDYNDKYSKSIIDFIEENNLKNFIFLYGIKTDIENILSQATIGVLSSKFEGLPISLLEYGLAKLPVLVTDAGECGIVVNNRKAVVQPQNSFKFAEKLEMIILSDKIKKEISTSLYNNVKEHYSRKNFINNLIKIYQNI